MCILYKHLFTYVSFFWLLRWLNIARLKMQCTFWNFSNILTFSQKFAFCRWIEKVPNICYKCFCLASKLNMCTTDMPLYLLNCVQCLQPMVGELWVPLSLSTSWLCVFMHICLPVIYCNILTFYLSILIWVLFLLFYFWFNLCWMLLILLLERYLINVFLAVVKLVGKMVVCLVIFQIGVNVFLTAWFELNGLPGFGLLIFHIIVSIWSKYLNLVTEIRKYCLLNCEKNFRSVSSKMNFFAFSQFGVLSHPWRKFLGFPCAMSFAFVCIFVLNFETFICVSSMTVVLRHGLFSTVVGQMACD